MLTSSFDYVATPNHSVWLGDCSIVDGKLVARYSYFGRDTPSEIKVFRADGKGYLLEVPPELRMLPHPVNFFKRVEYAILDTTTSKVVLE